MRKLLTDLANDDGAEGAPGRHSVLLASLIVLLVVLPVGQALLGGTPLFPLLLALVLISAVMVNSHQRWVFVVARAACSSALAASTPRFSRRSASTPALEMSRSSAKFAR